MKTDQWKPYVDGKNEQKLYYCSKCRKNEGRMMYRYISEDSDPDHMHKEYKVICTKCGKQGSMHYSLRLAEYGWGAMNEP